MGKGKKDFVRPIPIPTGAPNYSTRGGLGITSHSRGHWGDQLGPRGTLLGSHWKKGISLWDRSPRILRQPHQYQPSDCLLSTAPLSSGMWGGRRWPDQVVTQLLRSLGQRRMAQSILAFRRGQGCTLFRAKTNRGKGATLESGASSSRVLRSSTRSL